MPDLLRRALDAVLLRDDPFSEVDPLDLDCDCPACTFGREVENLTAGHIVAAILNSPDLDGVLARAAMVSEAVTFAVDTANHEWRQADPAVSAEVDALDALYNAPAFGEEGWTTI